MRDAQVGVGEHLHVPRFGCEAAVEQEARRGDENDLLPDLVGRVHEQVIDGGVPGTPAVRLLLVGRVADDNVEPLAHGSVAFLQHLVDHRLALLRGHACEIPDFEVPGLLEPRLPFRDAPGDSLQGDLVQDLAVAHLEDL